MPGKSLVGINIRVYDRELDVDLKECLLLNRIDGSPRITNNPPKVYQVSIIITIISCTAFIYFYGTMLSWKSPLWAIIFLGSVVRGHHKITDLTNTHVVELSSLPWTLTNANNSISIPAAFPSQVHLDLLRAGTITEPYVGSNQYDLRWVAMDNWTYSTIVPQSGTINNAFLVFDGLDTFATVRLCDVTVGRSENQFRQYVFDMTLAEEACSLSHTQHLSIEFTSAITVANELASRPGQKQWAEGIQGVFEYPNREFIRKQQNDFGWDWGPAFSPSGPWLPGKIVYLGVEDHYITNFYADIHYRGQTSMMSPNTSEPWIVDTGVEWIGHLDAPVFLHATLTDSQGRMVKDVALSNVTYGSHRAVGSFNVTNGFVDLWWPAGMGLQTMYNLSLDVLSQSTCNPVAHVDTEVGFRSVVLKYENVTETEIEKGVTPGSHFSFEVNGQPFYAKGSNLIPPDAFWSRVRPSKIQQLFEAATESNLNMLRIWSSGSYLPDYAYTIADKLGLLLWSEFQFSDAIYPTDAAFVENVRREVEHQVRRVNHHPSLALWSGGNEIEGLELNLVKEISPNDYKDALKSYIRLFGRNLASVVFNNTKSVSYIPSSSGNGMLSVNVSDYYNPLVFRLDNVKSGEIHGTTDYYNYDTSQAFNISRYPVGRFAVEFGFHSMPSVRSLEQVLPRSSLRFLNSTNILQRTKHYPAGNPNHGNYSRALKGVNEMITAVKDWYPAPNKRNEWENFYAWCLATQVFQADFVRSQVQHYKRGVDKPEQHRGTLYWQLNDIWQGPSWSGIEYDGGWKPLQYMMREEFKPVTSSFVYNETTDNLDVILTSTSSKLELISVELAFMDWEGHPVQANVTGIAQPAIHFLGQNPESFRTVIFIQPLTSQVLFSIPLDGIKGSLLPLRRDIYLVRSKIAIVPTTQNLSAPLVPDPPNVIGHTAWYHPVPLSQAPLVDPRLKVSLQPIRDNEIYRNTRKLYNQHFIVEAQTGVAAWVWLDYQRLRRPVERLPGYGNSYYRMRDNNQMGNEPFDLDVYSDTPIHIAQLKKFIAENPPIDMVGDLLKRQRQQIQHLIMFQQGQIADLREQNEEGWEKFKELQAMHLTDAVPSASPELLQEVRGLMESQGLMFEQLGEKQLESLAELHQRQLTELKALQQDQLMQLKREVFVFSPDPTAADFDLPADSFDPPIDQSEHPESEFDSPAPISDPSMVEFDPPTNDFDLPRGDSDLSVTDDDPPFDFAPEQQSQIDKLLELQYTEEIGLTRTQGVQLVKLMDENQKSKIMLAQSSSALLEEARKKVSPAVFKMFEAHIAESIREENNTNMQKKDQLMETHQLEQVELRRKHAQQLKAFKAALLAKAGTSKRVSNQILIDSDAAIRALVEKQHHQTNELIQLQELQIDQLTRGHGRLLNQLAMKQQTQLISMKSKLSPIMFERFKAATGKQFSKFQKMEGTQLARLKELHGQQLQQLNELQQLQLRELRADLSTPLPMDNQTRVRRLRQLQQEQTNDLLKFQARQMEQLISQQQELNGEMQLIQQEHLSSITSTVPPVILEQIREQNGQQSVQFQTQHQQQIGELHELHRRQLQEIAETHDKQMRDLRDSFVNKRVLNYHPTSRMPTGEPKDMEKDDGAEKHQDEDDRNGDGALYSPHLFPTRVHFIDNGFWLQPGERRAVEFVAYRMVNPAGKDMATGEGREEGVDRDQNPSSASTSDPFVSPADMDERQLTAEEVDGLSVTGWMKRMKVTSMWDWQDHNQGGDDYSA